MNLNALLTEIQTRLTGATEFSTLPSIPIDVGSNNPTYEDKLADAMNTAGFAVGIRAPVATVEHPNLPGPTQEVMVFVDVWAPSSVTLTNNILKLYEVVAGMLHHWQPTVMNGVLYGQTPELVNDDDGYARMVCGFHAQNVTIYNVTQVATPSVVKAGTSLTHTCATTGAAMFYTTNGKEPTPQNGTYVASGANSGPHSAGLTVKTRAYLAGYNVSDTTTTVTTA